MTDVRSNTINRNDGEGITIGVAVGTIAVIHQYVCVQWPIGIRCEIISLSNWRRVVSVRVCDKAVSLTCRIYESSYYLTKIIDIQHLSIAVRHRMIDWRKRTMAIKKTRLSTTI